MNRLKCLIVDDEPVARKIIREYIDDVDFLELSGEVENPARAAPFLGGDHGADLIFLDVQMPGMNGIDFLKTVHPAPMTVLTTAYPQYALQGFELDVLDYLVKPIGFDRFLKAAHKAREYHLMKTVFQENGAVPDAFFVKSDRRIEKIAFHEILYVQAMANYVVIHTPTRKYVAHLTLKGVEESLPADQFVRIHKSYVVALSAVTSIESTAAALGPRVLPVSKHYRTAAMQKIQPFLLKR
jgi:DNA-binding LytR/AlgR family response regulator